MKTKVLIIKLGYSETLDKEIGITTSLGDVLRTTVILNYLKNDDVTWLVDEKAFPLLAGNPYIRRILIFNLESALQLQRERFDTVINLEKGPGICALSDSVNAWRRFGFRFDADRGVAQAYDGAERVLSLCLDEEKKKGNMRYWQEALASIIGKKWSNEEYVVGYQPKSKICFDVGFNSATGSKWSNKAWPKSSWDRLARLLSGRYTVSRQKGLDNLYEYMDWIHSCRLVVSNDSLGLHLALAFGRKVVALFGPTSSSEVSMYDRGIKLLPRDAQGCVPCLAAECVQQTHCMTKISPQDVKGAIDKLLKKS